MFVNRFDDAILYYHSALTLNASSTFCAEMLSHCISDAGVFEENTSYSSIFASAFDSSQNQFVVNSLNDTQVSDAIPQSGVRPTSRSLFSDSNYSRAENSTSITGASSSS